MIKMQYGLETPAILVKSDRVHNSLVKRVMRTVIEAHHEERIPRHFKQSAHARYGYRSRPPRYIRFKIRRYGTGIDLIKTGATQRAMTSTRQITLGGSATTGGVNATLRLRFPFPGGTGRFQKQSYQAITVEEMAREIEAITPDEMQEINQQVHDGYVVLVDTDTSARQRIKAS